MRLVTKYRMIRRESNIRTVAPGPRQQCDIGRRHQSGTNRIADPRIGQNNGNITKVSRTFQTLTKADGSAPYQFLWQHVYNDVVN